MKGQWDERDRRKNEAIGSWGEWALTQHLLKSGRVRDVYDVTNKATFQKIGVDYILGLGCDVSQTLEIKTMPSIGKTGNLALEMVNFKQDRRSGRVIVTEGWYPQCKADILMFLDPVKGNVYETVTKDILTQAFEVCGSRVRSCDSGSIRQGERSILTVFPAQPLIDAGKVSCWSLGIKMEDK